MIGQLVEAAFSWLHSLAAAAWIGGLFFYLVVLRPTLRNISPNEAGKFMELAGVRFRAIGLVLLGVLLFTGLSLTHLALQSAPDRAEFLGSGYGRILGLKIAGSLLVILLSAWLALGPVPAMVSALETRDEIGARARGKLILYFGGLVLFLSVVVGLLAALLRVNAL